MNWTPDRPTKPGRYEVCFGPPRGFDGYRVWVVEVWREQPSGKLFAQRGILDIPINPDPSDIDTLTEALWRPYVEPPDPFAEPVPSLRERVEALRRLDPYPDNEHAWFAAMKATPDGDYLDRSEVLALLDEVTR